MRGGPVPSVHHRRLVALVRGEKLTFSLKDVPAKRGWLDVVFKHHGEYAADLFGAPRDDLKPLDERDLFGWWPL